MNKYIYKIIGLGLLTFTLSGCNQFLDQSPDDRIQIDDVLTAKELVVTAYNDYNYIPLFELRSDNVVDKGTRYHIFPNFISSIYLFEENVPSTYQDSPQGFWRASYKAIAAANQALSDLDRIGTSGSEADAVRGEALICRAYAMYMLAQTFTIPYDPETADNDLGLPYPTEPENEPFKKYERGTLKELYDKIAADFEKGYKIVGNNYVAPKFHFNRQAAAAFGTRLYRTLHNWDRVIELGNEVFRGNIPLYTRKINVPGPYNGTYNERRQIWTMETEKCNFLINLVSSEWSRYYAGIRYSVDTKLRNYFKKTQNSEFDGNFIGTDPAFTFFGGSEYSNIPKLMEHFKVTNKATQTGFAYTQVVLFSGDEVLFNMAEAYTMKNNLPETERLLQIFVSNFMDGYDASEAYKVTKEKIMRYYDKKIGQRHPDVVHGIVVNTFNPSFKYTRDQEAYLRACVDMKRLAFIHEGMRWMDNRHFRMDIVHNVYSAGDASQEFIVLRGTDPFYAYQLPINTRPYLEKNPGYDGEMERFTR